MIWTFHALSLNTGPGPGAVLCPRVRQNFFEIDLNLSPKFTQPDAYPDILPALLKQSVMLFARGITIPSFARPPSFHYPCRRQRFCEWRLAPFAAHTSQPQHIETVTLDLGNNRKSPLLATKADRPTTEHCARASQEKLFSSSLCIRHLT